MFEETYKSCDDDRAERLAAGLASLVSIQALRLSFAGCSVTASGLEVLSEGLSKLTRLPELSLLMQDCNVGDAGLPVLSAALPPRLESLRLDFTGCGVTARSAEQLMRRLRKLPLLSLDLRVPGPRAANAVQGLARSLARLRLRELRLDAGRGRVGPHLPDLAAALPATLEKLQVDLSASRLTGEQADAFGQACGGLPVLRALQLSLADCGLGDCGGWAWQGRLRRLELGLSRCGCGDEAASRIAQTLPQLCDLEQLNLDFHGCHIGPEGAKRLAAAAALPGLATLRVDFHGCPVGDRGAKALAATLGRIPNLSQLDLDVTLSRLSEAGAKRLRRAAADRGVGDGLRLDKLRLEGDELPRLPGAFDGVVPATLKGLLPDLGTGRHPLDTNRWLRSHWWSTAR